MGYNQIDCRLCSVNICRCLFSLRRITNHEQENRNYSHSNIAVLVLAVPATAQTSGEIVPPIIVHSQTQAERPVDYETTRLVVENMRELGLEVGTPLRPISPVD